MKLTVDSSAMCHVASCECGWRTTRGTRASIWTAVARHLRSCHGDPAAAGRAANAANMAAAREGTRKVWTTTTIKVCPF